MYVKFVIFIFITALTMTLNRFIKAYLKEIESWMKETKENISWLLKEVKNKKRQKEQS